MKVVKTEMSQTLTIQKAYGAKRSQNVDSAQNRARTKYKKYLK